MKYLTLLIITGILICLPAIASTQEVVSVEIDIRSHHGPGEKLRLKLIKDGASFKLIADDIVLPETRILTNRDDLKFIMNYASDSNDNRCERDTYQYTKTSDEKKTTFSGCLHTKNFRQLRNSFRNISAIR